MNDNPQPTANGVPHERSIKDKVKSLGREAKLKTNSLLHTKKHTPTPEEEAAEGSDNDPYNPIRDDPAFDPSKLVKEKPLSARLSGGFSESVKLIAHPRTAIKRKAAAKVAVKETPYLSRDADLEFLNAHDSLSKAKSTASRSNQSKHHAAVQEQRERIDRIESLRQSRKVAWTTSRHFKRAVVFPSREFPTPSKDDFYIVDSQTGRRRLDWTAWLRARNHNALKSFATNRMGNVDFCGQPPFDRDVSSRFMERILIASSPWQAYFLSLRSLYRWEDPAKSKKWFAIWFVVWWADYVVTFILAYTAIEVLRNKFQPKRVDEMRESYERALDQGSAAFKFNELITEHGADRWLDPVVDSVGPIIQIQLSDIADTLEALNHFYDWRTPSLTWATLFWFLCAVLIGALTPTGYSMKIVTMCVIGSFFLSRPVASMQPEYRHAVNAFNWIFWGFPNDAEWSMMYLRKKAQETRAELISKKVQNEHESSHIHRIDSAHADYLDIHSSIAERTAPGSGSTLVQDDGTDGDDTASFHTVDSATNILEDMDILSFRSFMQGISGRLVIFSDGLRFMRTSPLSSTRKEEWSRPWSQLVEISKADHNVAKLVKTEGLDLVFSGGIKFELEQVNQRDKAFNCILGFSGLRFQIVQPGARLHETFDEDGGVVTYDQ